MFPFMFQNTFFTNCCAQHFFSNGESVCFHSLDCLFESFLYLFWYFVFISFFPPFVALLFLWLKLTYTHTYTHMNMCACLYCNAFDNIDWSQKVYFNIRWGSPDDKMWSDYVTLLKGFWQGLHVKDGFNKSIFGHMDLGNPPRDSTCDNSFSCITKI